jgi:hypothetical protein
MSDIIEDDLPESVESEAPESSAPDAQQEVADAPEPQQAAPQGTVWDAFKAVPEFQGQDDRAIAVRLYQALQREKEATHALAQYQQVLPYAQQYLQDRPEYEKWRSAQQQPQQPVAQQAAAPQEKPWWNPPELRDAFKRYIVKDESGRDTIAADAPLDARHAITEYFAYKQQFAEKFLTNPEEALAPMVSKLAQQQAQAIVEARLEEAGRVQYVQTLEQQNKDWLFDEGGNVSPEGEAARTYIEQARALGISSPEARWNYALQMVERDLLHQVQGAQLRQSQDQAFHSHLGPQQAAAPATPPAPPAPQRTQAEVNMEFLRRAASRTANRAGVSTNSPEAGRRGLTFEEQLRQQLSGDGLI